MNLSNDTVITAALVNIKDGEGKIIFMLDCEAQHAATLFEELAPQIEASAPELATQIESVEMDLDEDKSQLIEGLEIAASALSESEKLISIDSKEADGSTCHFRLTYRK